MEQMDSTRAIRAMDWKTRMRLIFGGWALGSAVTIGLAIVDPTLLPLEEHGALCGLIGVLAGVVVVFAVYRWRPDWVPAWMLGRQGA